MPAHKVVGRAKITRRQKTRTKTTVLNQKTRIAQKSKRTTKGAT